MKTLLRRAFHLLAVTMLLTSSAISVAPVTQAIAELPGEGGGGPVIVPLFVSIDQAAGQADPTSTSPINFTVVFSAPVAGFSSAGVTLGGTAGATTAVVTGAGTTYNVAVSGMTSSGTVTASIPFGAVIGGAFPVPNNASTSTDNTVTYTIAPPDVTAPTITSVSATSSDGTYYSGNTIYITVNFSEAVNVTGIPQLRLETGDSDGIATYVSGSGTNVLIFSYTVAVGHVSADLNYTDSEALSLNEGSIRDAAGNNANLDLPSTESESSLAGNKALVISSEAAPDSGGRRRSQDSNQEEITTETETNETSESDEANEESTEATDGSTDNSGEGSVLGACTSRNEESIVIKSLKAANDQKKFLKLLKNTFGDKFNLTRKIKSASKGEIDHCDSAVINPYPNVLRKGAEMPDFSVSKGDKMITMSFTEEAVFLRPVNVILHNIGATDWKKIRITDENGIILNSFHLSEAGELIITTNYLRTLHINLDATVFANNLGVPPDDIEYDAINHLVELGIISGHPDHTYKALDPLKRSETGKLIALFIGLKSDNALEGDPWYAAHLRALAFTKIISSTDPEILETRATFLSMIAKAKGINISHLPACDTSAFSDVDPNIWYCPVIQYAREQNWLREASGNFKPEENTTRSWAAGILDRAF